MKKYDKPEFEVVFYDEKDNIMLSGVKEQQAIKEISYADVFNKLNS